jgi:DNA-binding NarL/FixJ family response regulator
MRILIVEDQGQLAGLVQRALSEQHHHEVTMAADPNEADARLNDEEYDVAVVDVHYDPLSKEFEARRRAHRVGLTSKRLLVSGLAVLRSLQANESRTQTVVWTSGEFNRHLHILFAYEEMHVRAFCSKSSSNGTVDPLNDAIRAAADRRPYVDADLNPYLPTELSLPLSRSLLREQNRRAVWRAIALGAHSRDEISAITGYSQRYIGNLVPRILDEDLRLVDPGIRPDRSPLNELVRFASQNWEFLLDDTVREMFP